MFKILLSSIIVSINLFAYGFACDCSADLMNTYMNTEQFIVDENLKEIDNNLDNVKNTLDENIEELDKDILTIKELNKTLKMEIMQLTEYNFNLSKQKKLLLEKE